MYTVNIYAQTVRYHTIRSVFFYLVKLGFMDTIIPKYVTMKAVLGSNLFLLLDENTQVNGIRFLIDFTGFDMKNFTYLGLDDMKKLTTVWMVSIQ